MLDFYLKRRRNVTQQVTDRRGSAPPAQGRPRLSLRPYLEMLRAGESCPDMSEGDGTRGSWKVVGLLFLFQFNELKE